MADVDQVKAALRVYRESMVRARYVAELLCALPLEPMAKAQERAEVLQPLARGPLPLDTLIEMQRDNRIVRALLEAQQSLMKEFGVDQPADVGKVS